MATTTRTYLDHASATPLDEHARAAMVAALDEFGDPLRMHGEGLASRRLLDDARATIAGALGAQPDEIVFTSGGTEADNLAVRGVLKARRGEADKPGPHLVISSIEHHAVIDTAEDLERHAHVRVAVVGVDRDGRVDPADVERAIGAAEAERVPGHQRGGGHGRRRVHAAARRHGRVGGRHAVRTAHQPAHGAPARRLPRVLRRRRIP